MKTFDCRPSPSLCSPGTGWPHLSGTVCGNADRAEEVFRCFQLQTALLWAPPILNVFISLNTLFFILKKKMPFQFACSSVGWSWQGWPPRMLWMLSLLSGLFSPSAMRYLYRVPFPLFLSPQKQFALIHCHTPLGNTQGRTHFVRMTLILSWPPNRTEIACFHQSLEPEDKVEKFLNDYDIICLDISWSTFSWKINLKLKVNIKFNGHYLANMVYSVLIWFQGNTRKFHKIQRLGI